MDKQFVIFYVKENKIYPVVMSEEQRHILNDIAVPLVFSDTKTVQVIDKPCGEIEMKKGKE